MVGAAALVARGLETAGVLAISTDLLVLDVCGGFEDEQEGAGFCCVWEASLGNGRRDLASGSVVQVSLQEKHSLRRKHWKPHPRRCCCKLGRSNIQGDRTQWR